MTTVTQFEYIYYGTQCDADEVKRFLTHNLDANVSLETRGQKKTPVCIWGRHGIGKTQIVQDVAKQRSAAFVSIAPAQFEEMGDLLGMPTVEAGGTSTKMAAPSWVPREPGPGILLIDDVNRADDRILRGMMQLLQDYELASWKLPLGWDIVLTANPDGGDYSVTAMDDAMLTRMLHITLRFDVKRWAAWAEVAGIDPRGIAFVLMYPETVTGARTTPRTLVQFFDRIRPIDDLKQNIELVSMLGEASLDKATVATFIAFVSQNLEQLISPEEILAAKSVDQLSRRLAKLTEGDVKRLDMLSAICTRLINYLTVNNKKPLAPKELDNLREFLRLRVLPEDMRLALAQDLSLVGGKSGIAKLLGDPDVAKMLLSGTRK